MKSFGILVASNTTSSFQKGQLCTEAMRLLAAKMPNGFNLGISMVFTDVAIIK